MLSNFDKYELDGQRLLRIVYLKQHTSALFEVVLAFTMFFWLISLALIGYSWWSSSRSKNPLFYAACLIVGASMAFASSIFFYLLPKSDAICELRKWLLAGGMTLLLGVMFARGWQLHALKSGPRIISTKKLLIIVSIIFGVQAILLICWTAIDTWESRTKFTNPIDLTARYECSSDHNIVWLLLELAFFLILLAWGIYVVYATWRNRAAVDSRWTLIAVYNSTCHLQSRPARPHSNCSADRDAARHPDHCRGRRLGRLGILRRGAGYELRRPVRCVLHLRQRRPAPHLGLRREDLHLWRLWRWRTRKGQLTSHDCRCDRQSVKGINQSTTAHYFCSHTIVRVVYNHTECCKNDTQACLYRKHCAPRFCASLSCTWLSAAAFARTSSAAKSADRQRRSCW